MPIRDLRRIISSSVQQLQSLVIFIQGWFKYGDINISIYYIEEPRINQTITGLTKIESPGFIIGGDSDNSANGDTNNLNRVGAKLEAETGVESQNPDLCV
ncbi:hypothetical protein K7X08_025148 [Anisodus acutangulus]|uniref:Uncharacterized protein n=1 Tax=Anisodus acutangulus TaxID=402998 RepID=A0A9Q1ME69_9SOLA|nr:hypothetical protein K7X08_025148 [Anisodus acutangulus]